MRVLLIGGSGFIGRSVVSQLQRRGHDVIIFHRGQTGALSLLPDVSDIIIGNRLEIDQHLDAIKAARPDSAIDLLPWAGTDTEHVIQTLNGHVERVVHLSSADVYQAWGNFLKGGYSEPVPLSEDSPLRTELYPYAGSRPGASGYDKVLAERAIFKAHYEHGYPGLILRLPMVYGPEDSQFRMWPYIKRILDGRRHILMGACQGSWLWHRGFVENVAFAITLAAERQSAVGQAYNVGNPMTRCLAAWVEAIGEIMAWRGSVRLVPHDDLPKHLQNEYNYHQHIILDTTRIRRELGYYELVDSQNAMRLTVEWQRENPPQQGDDDQFDYDSEDAVLKALPAVG